MGRPSAQPAADAVAFVDQNDAVLDALIAGPCRADGDAGRVFAVQAGFGEVDQLRGALSGCTS